MRGWRRHNVFSVVMGAVERIVVDNMFYGAAMLVRNRSLSENKYARSAYERRLLLRERSASID